MRFWKRSNQPKRGTRRVVIALWLLAPLAQSHTRSNPRRAFAAPTPHRRVRVFEYGRISDHNVDHPRPGAACADQRVRCRW